MAFTERQEYKVEVLPPHNILQVRRADIVEKDGKEVGRTYHRHCCVPGTDVSGDCAQVQAIAGALWTDEAVAAYQAYVASLADPGGE